MDASPLQIEEIRSDIRRISAILATDIFEPINSTHPLQQSAFAELMICLRDLLYKADKLGVPVKFTDAVDVTKDVSNVAELVKAVRDAVCHVTSFPNLVPVAGVMYILNVHYSKGALVVFANGKQTYTYTSDFDDDVCFFFGTLRIYLNRHIIRAYNEAVRNLMPFI